MNIDLKKKTMSIAQKLIAQGKAEGLREARQERLQQGVWMGKVPMIEELMGLVVTPAECTLWG